MKTTKKTDGRIMYKDILNAKLKTGKRSKKTELPKRHPLRRRRSASMKRSTRV